VFKLERHVVRIKDNKVMDEVVYGLTSLVPEQASTVQLLTFIREYCFARPRLLVFSHSTFVPQLLIAPMSSPAG
jgi:hypothetical protein